MAAPWIVAAVLGSWTLLIQLVMARTEPLSRSDEGLLLTTVTYLIHGQLPITDFYEPYGVGLGVPGALDHLVGLNSVLAIRITYGLFPVLVTVLATVFVWRRTDWKLAILVGVASVAAGAARYSMAYAALFGAMLLVDRFARRTTTGSLEEVAARHPYGLATAAAVLSLAGWARIEYQTFGLIWAAVLAFALRGRKRVWQALAAAGLAVLPTLLVLVTGGATHLWWIVRYLASSSPDGFKAQRGVGVDWSFITARLNELAHLQLGSVVVGHEVAGYGVGIVVVVAGAIMFLVPRFRRVVVARDPAYLTPFMVLVAAVVLYGLFSNFNMGYADTGAVIVWAAGALLVRRISAAVALLVGFLVAFPFGASNSPGLYVDDWNSRPPTPAIGYAPGLKDIPVVPDNGGPSMAALVGLWHQLGLQGRSTIVVARRNDEFWSNDMIIGYLLNAPAAAWPLTYDPGVVNRDDVERATVQSLCRNHAPVVQLDHNYEYRPGQTVYVGSRRLDEFLATDYRVRAVAGFYRILLPVGRSCVMPSSLAGSTLTSLRDSYVAKGDLPAAGAIAIALIDRERAQRRPVDWVDASIAALGGYQLQDDELPPDPLGLSLRSLVDQMQRPSLLVAANIRWPNDIEALAAQTAWLQLRAPNDNRAVAAVLSLAIRHPNWPQAIQNVTGVVPPSDAVFRRLRGAVGDPVFDVWRRDYYRNLNRFQPELSAALAAIADYVRIDDPLNAAHAEFELSALPGLPEGCRLLLRQAAAAKPGIGIGRVPGPAPSCSVPAVAHASL